MLAIAVMYTYIMKNITKPLCKFKKSRCKSDPLKTNTSVNVTQYEGPI